MLVLLSALVIAVFSEDDSGCTDLESAGACTEVNGVKCYWDGDSSFCRKADCNQLEDGGACNTIVNGITCYWDESYCREKSCGDLGSGTCTTVNGRTCISAGSNCHEANCGSYDESSTCPTSVNNQDCVWNSEKDQCQRKSCNNFNDQGSCTGKTVDGDTCVWNPDDAECVKVGCDDFAHGTSGTCQGDVAGETCYWYSDGNCRADSCGNPARSNAAACPRTVDAGQTICVWDGSSCGDLYCGSARTQGDCSTLHSTCSWFAHGTCSFCGTEDMDPCSGAPNESICSSEQAKACGCKWADGKCFSSSSTSNMAIPMLLVTILLSFLI